MVVRVRVLGAPAVEHEGGVLPSREIGGARERRLLAILAVARHHVVPKDQIVEQLWDTPPAHPVAAVDAAVSLLRRGLRPAGVPIVATQRPGYQLVCPTDLDDLDRWEGEHRWDEVLDLLDQGFLADEPTNDWVERERDRFLQRRVEALVRGAQAASVAGDDEQAHRLAQSAVAADGLREDAHRLVIGSLARLGREAEALRAYEHCRRVVRNELGTSPAGETMALYEQVLAGQQPPVGAGAPPRAGSLPLLGRRQELARLLAARDGCVVWAVLGEPGIGKTRLVEEVIARKRPASVRSTKCFRLVSPVPYTVLGDLAPEVVTETGGLSPEAGASQLARKWLERLQTGPDTLVVDDLQWADEPSLVVLGLVVRARPEALTVLVTARDGDLGPDSAATQFLELAGGSGVLETVTLAPLAPSDLTTAGLTMDDWQRSGGHPLFLQHLVTGGGGDLASLIMDRVTALGPAAQDLLRAAAILDRSATPAELVAVADSGDHDARAALHKLGHAGLMQEEGGSWRPRHDVIAEVVRDELADDARTGWHARALAVLAASGTAAPAELAHQALGAGQVEDALRHSLDAGDRALAAFANREARDHYARAVQLIQAGAEGAPDAGRRARCGQARALIVLGRTAEASAILEEVPPTEGRAEAERLLLRAECAWAGWKPSQAIEPVLGALAVAESLGDDELTERVHGFAANPYGSLGRFPEARRHIDAAMALAARHDRSPPATTWYRLGLVQHQTGHEREALVTLDRCREAAAVEHDERSLVFERIVRSWCLGALGHYGEALSALDDVASIGKGEEAVARARVPNTRAWLLADLGLVDMALEADEESLEIARDHGGASVAEPQIHTLLNLSCDHLHLGDPDRAQRCLDEAEALAVDAEYARFRFLNRMAWVRGLLALEAGNGDAALEAADETAALADRYQAPRYVVRAELLRAEVLAPGRRASSAAAESARHLRHAARLATEHGFAALAEQAHARLAMVTGSDRHRREADRLRAQIVGSVDGVLRDRLLRR